MLHSYFLLVWLFQVMDEESFKASLEEIVDVLQHPKLNKQVSEEVVVNQSVVLSNNRRTGET